MKTILTGLLFLWVIWTISWLSTRPFKRLKARKIGFKDDVFQNIIESLCLNKEMQTNLVRFVTCCVPDCKTTQNLAFMNTLELSMFIHLVEDYKTSDHNEFKFYCNTHGIEKHKMLKSILSKQEYEAKVTQAQRCFNLYKSL